MKKENIYSTHKTTFIVGLLFLAILMYPFIRMLAKDNSEPFIEWKKVDISSGYQIQIKNEKGIQIKNEQVKDSKYPISSLGQGKYQVRVGILSPFGKPVTWSNWTSLEIQEKKSKKALDELALKEKARLEEEKRLREERERANKELPTKQKEDSLTREKAIAEEEAFRKKCNNTKLPLQVIKDCKDDFIILDLSTKQKRNLYSIYTLKSSNRTARIQVAKYYQNHCKMADENVLKELEKLSDSDDPVYNDQEQSEYKKALQKIKSCN